MYRRDGAVVTAHLVFITALVLFAAARSGEADRLAVESLARWFDGNDVSVQLCRPGTTRAKTDYMEQVGAALWEADGATLVPYDAPACGG
jgi:hypothetical protein